MTPRSDTDADATLPPGAVTVDFCGALSVVPAGSTLTIGRDADLVVDDNPFLHRVFLVLSERDGLWFLSNAGSQLSATVSDRDGRMEAFLAPGAAIPLVFGTTRVAFTAGPTTYELQVVAPAAAYEPPVVVDAPVGATTVGRVGLTRDQRLLIVALAEPRLRGDGRASVMLPSSPQAARRLGWTPTKFGRKLDNVCDKLTKLGVRGLRGDIAEYASNRRSRLVEYAVATRLVTRDDLAALDALAAIGGDDD
ncbi:MAG TPA: hypothetical protein VNQ73_18250 [Ilumatobacter sp.]|nr:hypothetical protein [Ilumatobacter sp.]